VAGISKVSTWFCVIASGFLSSHIPCLSLADTYRHTIVQAPAGSAGFDHGRNDCPSTIRFPCHWTLLAHSPLCVGIYIEIHHTAARGGWALRTKTYKITLPLMRSVQSGCTASSLRLKATQGPVEAIHRPRQAERVSPSAKVNSGSPLRCRDGTCRN
jgi:hypothetical protein